MATVQQMEMERQRQNQPSPERQAILRAQIEKSFSNYSPVSPKPLVVQPRPQTPIDYNSILNNAYQIYLKTGQTPERAMQMAENWAKAVASGRNETITFTPIAQPTPQIQRDYSSTRPTEVGAAIIYDINKLIATERAFREKYMQKWGLATPLLNYAARVGEKTLEIPGPLIYAAQHPIQTYRTVKQQIQPSLEEIQKKGKGEVIKVLPIAAGTLALAGGKYVTGRVGEFFTDPLEAAAKATVDLAFLMYGPKIVKTTPTVKTAREAVRFTEDISLLPSGKFLVNVKSTTGLAKDNIAIAKVIAEQLEKESIGKGFTYNLQKVGKNALEVTLSKEMSYGWQVGAGALKKAGAIPIREGALIDSLVPITRTLKEGEGVVGLTLSQDMGKWLYESGGGMLPFIKKQAVSEEVRLSRVAGFVKPHIEIEEFLVGKTGKITKVGEPMEDVFNFLGTQQPKMRVYKKGGISYVGPPNIFGQIRLKGEPDMFRELLVGGAKGEMSQLQKIALQTAALTARGAKVRQVTTIVKTIDPVAVMTNSLIGTTRAVSKTVKTKQVQIQTPSATMTNLLVGEGKQIPETRVRVIQQPKQGERYATTPYVRQFAKVDTSQRMAELLLPRIRERLKQEERQKQRMKELTEFQRPQPAQRVKVIQRPLPSRGWTLLPPSITERRPISRKGKKIEKRKKGKYQIKPTESQLVWGFRLPRGLELTGGDLTGFEIARI